MNIPNNITLVTEESINNLKYHNFDTKGTEYSKLYNTQMLEISKKLLSFAKDKANSTEVISLIRNDNFKYTLFTNYSYNSIILPDNVINRLKLTKNQFTLIHNHPKNSGLSLRDFILFLSYRNIQSIMAIANNGRRVFYMVKSKKSNYDAHTKFLDKIILDIQSGTTSFEMQAVRYEMNMNELNIMHNVYFN